MDKEEAIKWLGLLRKLPVAWDDYSEETANIRRAGEQKEREAIDVAIETLEYIEKNKDILDLVDAFAELGFDMNKIIWKAQEWIPCNERLPEKKGLYFVTEQNFGRRKEADTHEVVSHSAYYYGDDKWSDRFYLDDVSNITAWLPLPEPYKQDAYGDEAK